MTVYYNEFDRNAAEWLRNLGSAGEISQGVVDERSIKEVRGADLAGIRRTHFFAGIGGWDLALKLAGWPDDREVWTGSCPCQPFSSAGKGKGTADERHLWPEFFRLIAERRPSTVFGEQVASKAGLGWLDGVFADLEGEGYTCGAVVVGAHSVGAPHIRQRLYWVADQSERGRVEGPEDGRGHGTGDGAEGQATGRLAKHGIDGWLADGNENGRPTREDERGSTQARDGAAESVAGPISRREFVRMAHSSSTEWRESGDAARDEEGASYRATGHGPWSDFRLVLCTDGKARRTGARVFPLAHGIPRGVGAGGTWRKGLARSASRARVGMLRGSGNAIVPDLAADFVRAYMDVTSAGPAGTPGNGS